MPGVASQLLEVLSAPRLPAGGTRTVRVALHPSALGEVRATVSAGRGGLSVDLEASTADGLEAVRRSLPELHAALVASGGRAVVSVSEAGSKDAARMSGARLEGWGQLTANESARSGSARSESARSGSARNESTGEGSKGDGWGGERPSSDGHAPHHGGHETSGHGPAGHTELGQPGDRRRPAGTTSGRAAATGGSRAAKGEMAAPRRARHGADGAGAGAGATGAGSPTSNPGADGTTPVHLVDVHV